MTGSLVLVTGAGGFIGRHLVRDLATAGYRVRAVSRGRLPADPRLLLRGAFQLLSAN